MATATKRKLSERKLSDEHKAKMAEGRKRKEDELARLREENERYRQAMLAQPPKPEESSTVPPEATGYVPEHSKATAEMWNNMERGRPAEAPQSGIASDVLEKLRAELRADLARMLPERQMPERRSERTVARMPARVVYDREGNVLRRGNSGGDPFAIPGDLRESDWDYQWIRCATYNLEDVDNQVQMAEAGWRPIMSNRPGWDGRFMPHGFVGRIFKQGLMLVERPMALTEEARAEDKHANRNQERRQREQFGLNLPSGYRADTPAARAHSGVRTGPVERMPDNLRPQLEIEY